MKLKYLAITLPVFAAALALTVAPALAGQRGDRDRCDRDHRDRCQQSGSIEVNNNNGAGVENNVGAISNTGLNAVVANEGDSGVATGLADSYAKSETQANGNETRIAVQRYDRIRVNNNNNAGVENNVGAISNTGLNMVHGCGCDDDNDCDDGCDKPCDRDRCGDGGRRGHHGHHGGHGDNDDEAGVAYVETGEAWSWAESMTMLNTNMTVID